MDAAAGSEIRELLVRLGRSWGWFVAYGVLSIVAGIIAIVWPGATLVAIAIIFALQLLLTSVFEFVFAFTVPVESGWLRALFALLAIVSFAIALFLLHHVGLTLLLVAVLLGAYWIAQGVADVLLAIEHPATPGRGSLIIFGILGIVAGAVVILLPGTSLVFFTYLLGFWLILLGVGLGMRGLALRSLARRTSG